MGAIAENPFLEKLVETSTLKSDSKLGSHSDSLPVVDFSLLTSSDHHQRSKTLHRLDAACREWGFFILVNHGIPETLLKAMIAASLEFFDLPDEEKRRYEGKSVSDTIKSGTLTANQGSHLWRDFVKSHVHPEFNCPRSPQTLRDNLNEYSKKTRVVFRELMHAIGENLGFEEGFIDEVLQLDSSFQLFAANYYPPCPQPDQAIGIPAHTDYGLLTLLIHNGVPGLQIEQNGEWFDTSSPQNAILVNNGDHLEILSNGRYKSVRHRAVVNTEVTRISVVMANGAAPEAVVAPAPQLVEHDGRPLYRPMKFIEYVETAYSNPLRQSNLDRIKIQDI